MMVVRTFKNEVKFDFFYLHLFSFSRSYRGIYLAADSTQTFGGLQYEVKLTLYLLVSTVVV